MCIINDSGSFWYVRIDLAQLLCCCLLRELTNQRTVFGRKDLKETEAKKINK